MHQEQTSILIGGILEEKWRGEWVYFIQADVGWKAWWVVQVNNICLDAMYTGEIKFTILLTRTGLRLNLMIVKVCTENCE